MNVSHQFIGTYYPSLNPIDLPVGRTTQNRYLIYHNAFDKTKIFYLKKVVNLGELASIEAIMSQLARRRASCRRRINELSSTTARIPSEILSEIFLIACQPVNDGRRSRKAVTPPFIGSICRRWRDVAWSTPFLWNTILLHISRKNHGTQVQFLRDRLLKASSAPLNIRLTAEDDAHLAFEAIMRILVTRSDYWLTFNSSLPPLECQNILENINFPMLTSVSLHFYNFETSLHVNNMFLIAPKLVDVYLKCCNSSVMLPWEQIRRFRSGASTTVAEFWKVLRQSPNLEECHFKYIYIPDRLIFETVISHAQLKYLDVVLQDSRRSMSLFDSITLPSLTNLRIQSYGSKGLRLSSLTSLVLRSACNLERFTIGISFIPADLIPCLETIPSLTFLHLDLEMPSIPSPYIGLTRHFVESLDPLNNSSGLLLPNLKHFKFKGQVLCDYQTIVDMLAHRWHLSDDGESSHSGRVSKLKLVEILSIAPYHVPSDMQEKIRNLLEEGIVISIESLVGS